MDETGLTLAHKPGKVVAEKGAKTVHAKCSTQRQLVTVIVCANAKSNTVPPHFIIPGKTKRSLLSYDSEYLQKTEIKNANISLSESGWTKDGIGRLWFESTFLPFIGQHRPQLLVCDGHSSHNNVEFIELARRENIKIIELPSHTSHWTQPLDRSFFKSLKNTWNSEVSNFTQVTGVPVGHGQFFRMFHKAWVSATEPSVVKNGFKATGIFPFDPEAIPNDAYKPATLYSCSDNFLESSASAQLETSDISFESSSSAQPEKVDQPNVNSIYLDLPLFPPTELTSATLIDLPITMDTDGLMSFESLATSTADGADLAPVTNEKALEVLESTMDSAKLLKFTAALLGNKEIKVPLFQTWKMYKENTATKTSISDPLSSIIQNENSESNILSLPNPIPRASKAASKRNKPETQYFAITADDAYSHKKTSA